MSPVTHFLTGWVLASSTGLRRRERAAVTLAAVVPDLDGIGAIPEYLTRHAAHPLAWFTLYHHALHNLVFGIFVAAIAFSLATRRVKTALLALLAFHLHLFEDVLGSRGPDGYSWPIPYLWPLKTWQWSWAGQWALNSWQNILLTTALLLTTLVLAVRCGISPLELCSDRADRALVETLRRRFFVHEGVGRSI